MAYPQTPRDPTSDRTSSQMWADSIFGTGSFAEPGIQRPGVMGTGMYQATPYQVDQNAQNIPNLGMWRDMNLRGAAAAGGRAAPMYNAGEAIGQLGKASLYGGAQIETGPQSQMRGFQANLAQQLQDQAAGKGPSLAQMQLQQATDRNMQQAMALGASQRGMGAGGAVRDIGNQRAAIGQQMAGDSGVLRLQEQQGAQALLGQVAGGARGQDLALATNQAGMYQQAGLANQDAQNQFAMTRAGLTQQAGMGNQQAQLQQGALNDRLVQFYLNSGMTMDMAQQQARMQMQQLNSTNQLGFETLQSGNFNNAAERQRQFFKDAMAGVGEAAKGAGQIAVGM